MAIFCQSGLLTFGQGYLIFGVGDPQDCGQIFTSLQHCHRFLNFFLQTSGNVSEVIRNIKLPTQLIGWPMPSK